MSRSACYWPQRGFTLLELVGVILILAIASVPLFSLFTQAGIGLLRDESLQTATQLAQERAETLLAIRRNRGYADAEISTDRVETLNGDYAGYTRTTRITPFAGTACPGGGVCKQVAVRVDQAGQPRAELTFILVNY